MKFLDVKTDYAFKKVFGSVENKDILISFLNSLLEFPNGEKIKDLEIVDPYNIPMLKGMKDTYVDVKAKLNDDSTVIIEMQVLNHEGFEKRILYNAAKNYGTQLVKGEDYNLINPVIALTIVDFEMFKDMEKYISRFKLLEKENFIKYSDDIEMIFIELPKFNKTLEECETLGDKWIYFIKNAGDLTVVPKEVKEEKEITKALEVINEACLSQEELEAQYKRKQFISIQKLALRKAINDGLAQGKKEKAIEIAMNLLDVLDDEIIAIKTGLSVEEIKKLR